MRLVFFGTSDFAVPALERIAQHVVLVVSQPDKPSGRGLALQPSAVKVAANELGLAVECPIKSRAPEFAERLSTINADLFVVASYGQILSKSLLDIPRHGCVNLHASILPQYRGASPIQSAILAGEKESGVSLMQMDIGLDTGAVIAVEKIPIGSDETAGELHDRLAQIAAVLISDWIERLATGQYNAVPQDVSQATHSGKINKADAELDFQRDADAEYTRLRAYTPYPGAYLQTSSGTLRVRMARLAMDRNGVIGTVLETKPDLVVAFRSGSLVLNEVQPQGRRTISGSDFANGARIAVGDCLLP